MLSSVILMAMTIVSIVNSFGMPGVVIPNGAGEPHDLKMNVSERMTYWGYPSTREYTVTSEDGYMIYIQRIQNKRYLLLNETESKPVVFLQHGLMSSSGCWSTNLPGQSLAYVLADAGYDVWMGNVRGNTYGKRHIKMNPKQRRFWDFTWTDMAMYDLPAMIDFVLKTSGQTKIAAYVGHSQGTMLGFKLFSTRVQYAQDRISTFIAMAPVNTVGHITGGIKQLAPFDKQIKGLLAVFGEYSLGGLQWLLKYIKRVCMVSTAYIVDCDNVYFAALATTQLTHINVTRMPVIISGYPDDTSMKNMAHFAQMVNSDKFEEYNYGPIKNLMVYKSFKTPSIDVSKITIPTQLYYSINDTLADPVDIEENMVPYLTHVTHCEKMVSDPFQHADYCIALSATQRVYQHFMARIPQPYGQNTTLPEPEITKRCLVI